MTNNVSDAGSSHRWALSIATLMLLASANFLHCWKGIARELGLAASTTVTEDDIWLAELE